MSLAPVADGALDALVKLTREELSADFDKLVAQYRERPVTGAILAGRTKLVDRLLRQLWRGFAMPGELALVAVGGYGRGELYPYSDIDLLVLLPEPETPELRARIGALITAFWDVGLEIGQSVRTIDDCLREAGDDITVQTNLLEARLLVGDAALFERFSGALREQLSLPDFFEAKSSEQEQRYARYEDTPYSLEPNCKESPGGLRDLQMLVWISRAAGYRNDWREFLRHGLVTPSEARELRDVERFLQHTRIRLHLLTGRCEDRLLFDHQDAIARAFGCEPQGAKRASEVFMQQYYINAKKVTQLNTLLLLNFSEQVLSDENSPAMVINDDFQSVRELLDICDDEVFSRRPSAMFECLLMLGQRMELKGLTARTVRSLWQHRTRINAAFRADPENKALFVSIFHQKRNVLGIVRRLNQFGLLSRYLPAWNKILCQMQHDLFHVYTVDEHCLMVLRNLRRLTKVEHSHEYPLMSRLILAFEDRWVLYVAALFHDIAKGRGGDHSKLGMGEARKFCVSHGLEAEHTELIVWLVGEHLTMSHIAQKQDIGDPDVVRRFAETVRDERHLTALYLLTHADIRGTSPKVWNSWKAKLLEDLFHSTQRMLHGATAQEALGTDDRAEDALRMLRFHGLRPGTEKTFWKHLDELYFLRHTADEISWHTRQLYYQPAPAGPIIKARLIERGDALQLMVYAPDADDLFKRICGCIARLGFTIFDAKIHTTSHGYALDSFMLQNPQGGSGYREVINLLEHELATHLSGEDTQERPSDVRLSRKLRHFAISPRVDIRADESGRKYVLSLTAVDRPYLLYDVAEVLGDAGVSVHFAKIATLGERVEDTFVIFGVPLANTQSVLRIKQNLHDRLKV